jgi:hypothetical protein
VRVLIIRTNKVIIFILAIIVIKVIIVIESKRVNVKEIFDTVIVIDYFEITVIVVNNVYYGHILLLWFYMFIMVIYCYYRYISSLMLLLFLLVFYCSNIY